MKSVLRYTAAGLALAAVGFASNASAATGSASATAEILSNLTVTASATDGVLNFGSITDSGLTAASTVVVSPADALTCGTNLTCTGTAAAPTFNVTGFSGTSVAVTFPSATATLTRTGGALAGMVSTMTVSALNSSVATVALPAGTGSFSIGATLTVNQLQAPGIYTGSVGVRVEYN